MDAPFAPSVAPQPAPTAVLAAAPQPTPAPVAAPVAKPTDTPVASPVKAPTTPPVRAPVPAPVANLMTDAPSIIQPDRSYEPHKYNLEDLNNDLGAVENSAVNNLSPGAIFGIILAVLVVVGCLCFRLGRRCGGGGKQPNLSASDQTAILQSDRDLI